MSPRFQLKQSFYVSLFQRYRSRPRSLGGVGRRRVPRLRDITYVRRGGSVEKPDRDILVGPRGQAWRRLHRGGPTEMQLWDNLVRPRAYKLAEDDAKSLQAL